MSVIGNQKKQVGGTGKGGTDEEEIGDKALEFVARIGAEPPVQTQVDNGKAVGDDEEPGGGICRKPQEKAEESIEP